MPHKLWLLKNPHTLSMVITLNPDGSVTADFPGLECAATVLDDDPWRARDRAILACAKLMVAKLEVPHGADTHRAA
jgi:hypothetical protein